MTNSQFFDSIPETVLTRKLEVDNNVWDLEHFMECNLLGSSVYHISLADAQEIMNLLVGESIFIETIKIKRLS